MTSLVGLHTLKLETNCEYKTMIYYISRARKLVQLYESTSTPSAGIMSDIYVLSIGGEGGVIRRIGGWDSSGVSS